MEKNYKMTLAMMCSSWLGTPAGPGDHTGATGERAEQVAEVVEVIGAGGTELAGVHARAMVANFLLDTALPPEEIRDYLNRYLPDAMARR